MIPTPRHATLASLLLLAACAGAPSGPPMPPPGRIHLRAFFGSPLTGPQLPAESTTRDTTAAARTTPAVECRWLYVARRNLPAVQPLASRTELIAAFLGDRPVQASLSALAGAGLVESDDVAALREVLSGAPTRELGPLLGAIHPATTLSFAIEVAAPLLPGAMASLADRSQLEIQVWETSTELRLAVAVTDQPVEPLALTEEEAEDSIEPFEPDPRRRVALLQDRLPADGRPLAIVVPSPFENDPVHAFVAVLRVAGDAAPHVATRTLAIARATSNNASARRQPADRALELRALQRAWTALRDADQRRSALHTLARAGGAELVADLTLMADDAQLAALIDELPEELPNDRLGDLGWLLEAQAYERLASILDRGELDPATTAAVLRHAGELGRTPGLLREALASCANLDELAQRWIAENTAFLQDSNPSARVRAFDWLKLRDSVPPNYDPLAERDARRNALEAAARAAAETAAQAAENQKAAASQKTPEGER